jgi:hypothetical protein
MKEQLELQVLSNAPPMTPRLLAAIEEEGTEELVDFFSASFSLAGSARDEYERLVDDPVCMMFEGNWVKALARPAKKLQFWKQPVYKIFNKSIFGMHRWVHDWVNKQIPVFVKNPYRSIEVTGEFGATNALFLHEGILFAGEFDRDNRDVTCLRPVRFSYQEDLHVLYQRVSARQSKAFGPASFAAPSQNQESPDA